MGICSISGRNLSATPELWGRTKFIPKIFEGKKAKIWCEEKTSEETANDRSL